MKKAKAPWNEPVHESRGPETMALYALDIPGSSKLKGLWHVEVEHVRRGRVAGGLRRASTKGGAGFNVAVDAS
jgi:hypothetical protein